MHVENFAVTAQATFGRDSAMFESLLGFVAQLSVGLWSLVVLTAVIRFVGIRIYRRSAARPALVEKAVPSAAVPAGLGHILRTDLRTEAVMNARFDVLRPAAANALVKGKHSSPHNRRVKARTAAHMPALAANFTDA